MEEDPAGSPGESPTSVEEIDSEGAFERLIESEERVLVDFYADWCGPCQLMAPTVEEFAGETDATVVKVNVEEAPGPSHQYDVRSIPTFLGFRGGEEIGRLVGMQDKTALEELIN
jgi:thioredoxin 1